LFGVPHATRHTELTNKTGERCGERSGDRGSERHDGITRNELAPPPASTGASRRWASGASAPGAGAVPGVIVSETGPTDSDENCSSPVGSLVTAPVSRASACSQVAFRTNTGIAES